MKGQWIPCQCDLINKLFHIIIYRSAWKKLGSMGKHDAMREYIDIIARYDPKWQTQVH
jgi:acyl-CoA-binding protein